MKRTLALTAPLLAMALPLWAQARGQAHGAQQADEAVARGFLANDVEAIVAQYAPDAVLFPPGTMVQKGQAAIRAGLAEFLERFRVTEFRMADTQYVTAGDISSGWGTFVMSAVPKGGGQPMRWEGRYTSVARRIRGKWLLVSDHASVPMMAPPGLPRPVSAPGR